jgi:hypothetical protein
MHVYPGNIERLDAAEPPYRLRERDLQDMIRAQQFKIGLEGL